MAYKWNGTFKTYLWNTPDGNLGVSYYALGPLNKKGLQTYIINLTDNERKKQNNIGDLKFTTDTKDIQGKTLTTAIGERVITEFIDEDGNAVRELSTEEKLEKLKSNPGEVKPEKVN